MFTLNPELAETEVVGKRDVITDVQNTKILSPNVVGHGFESHCITGSSMTSGPTSVTEVQQPHVTPSCKKMVHCVEGIDSSVDRSISEVPSVNSAFKKYDQLCPIYDVSNISMEEKFINTIIFANQGDKGLSMGLGNPVYNKWQLQVDFPFGFVPLGDQQMPEDRDWCQAHSYSPIQMHEIVRSTGKPNFLGAHLPVTSQLNVKVWQSLLKDYWDQ